MEKTYWFYSCIGKRVGIFLVTIAFFFLCKIVVKLVFCFYKFTHVHSEIEITKIHMHEL